MKRVFIMILCCLLLAGCSQAAKKLEQVMTPTEPIRLENPYGAEDFAVVGDYLACLSGAYQLGIDVSYWQEDIDWQQVADAGIEFVMIRVGKRGAGEGELTEDARGREYYAGAKAAGLKVGAYFFSQAITPAEALEEAEFAMQLLQDWELDMPLVYDWEHYSDNGRTVGMTGDVLTACTVTFCDAVKEAGYTPMVYFNQDQASRLDWTQLNGYPMWLAMYDQDMTYEYRVDMWQYTSSGSVPGISGDVDMNLYFIYE